MRVTYCLLISGLCLLVSQFASAQDNPMFDTPVLPLNQGPSLGTTSINVYTSAEGFDNFDLGVTNAEPHMVSNPVNPLWFFSAFNPLSGGQSFHTEDGMTWTSNNPSWPSNSGDPVAAYDSLGNLYYEVMKSPINACWVAKSTNNGQTWGTAVTSVAGVDKNWIAADQTMGPFANYIYTTMTRSGGGNLARSTDGGATWTNTFAPTTQSLPGMMVAVGPNVLGGADTSGGCVYVVTHSGTNSAGTYTFYVSRDGGATFTQKSANQFSNYIGTEIGGRSTVQGMRCRPYPMIAADNSFGPYRGRFYLAYASNNPSGNGNKSDIFLRYSTDQGATWSSPAVVNDDPNSQSNFQFHPAIWCDKQTGRLYIKFYDTRRTVTSDSMDVYGTYTDDGGETFATNQRLTTQKFKINISGATGPTYRGDYDAITSNRYASMAVWTDFRNGNYLGMTAYLPDFAMLTRTLRDTLKAVDSTTAVIKIPAVKLYTYGVKFTASVSPAAPFVLTFPNGDSLATVPDSLTLKIKANNVSNGNYVITVVGRGPNGTPAHRRTIPIRVQFIPNSVRVVQPNGGELWIQGQTRQIQWTSGGEVNNVRVEYSTNNGTSWSTIIASVPASTGFHNWTIPPTPSTQARVRVAWLDSLNTVRDQSDTTFILAAPTPLVSTTNDTLRAILQIGNNTTVDTLRLTNSGTIALNWTSTGTTWANASPASGSVPADSTRRFLVQFNSTGLQPGTYRGNLTITSNDTYHSPLLIPMRLTVTGIAQITVTPRDSLNFGAVRMGTTDTLSLRVRNTGSDTLRATSAISPPGRFATLTPTVKLAPNDSTTIRVTFTPLDSTSTYSATLRIVSNDPDPADDTVFVALRGRGATSQQLYSLSRNNINKAISDNQNTFDTLTVFTASPLSWFIRDVNVQIDTIIHPNLSDLEISLLHLSVNDSIVYRVGGSGANFVRTVLDDSATTPIANGTAPFTGRFRPTRPLAQFNTLDVSGAWILRIFDRATGNTGTLKAWSLSIYASGNPTSVELVSHEVPAGFQLMQNYPNPFNPSTTIRFGIPSGSGQAEIATLRVFDMLGREVALLVNDKLSPGLYTAHFETSGLSSGVYLYRLNAGKFVAAKKMILTK